MHKNIMRGVVATDGANNPGTRSPDESSLTRSALAVAFWTCLALAAALHIALAGTVLPNTPAGAALRSWLVAFNSGERVRMASFDQAHAPWLTLDGMMQRRAHSGGYDLLSVAGSGDFWIVFRARERKSSAEVIGSMVVRSYDPGHVTLLSFAPASARSTEVNLDDAERTRVVDGAAKLLDEYYLYPGVARKVSAKLKALQEHGEYDG